MEIPVVEIRFNALGQSHRVYDLKLKALSVYESEVLKVHPLAHIVSIENTHVTINKYYCSSFHNLKKWNKELEDRFDHIDKEAIL